MNVEEKWFKFIISGKVDDYLKFIDARRSDYLDRGEHDSLHNGCTCNQRNEHWR